MTADPQTIGGLEVRGRVTAEYREILTEEAMSFVADLVQAVSAAARGVAGKARRVPGANGRRRVARLPSGDEGDPRRRLEDCRHPAKTCSIARVEITGPVDRKMIINALNANVRVFMADFEDSLAPTWQNVVEGQINLRDANRRTIEFTNPDGKEVHAGAAPGGTDRARARSASAGKARRLDRR